jgi:hypothetical protein
MKSENWIIIEFAGMLFIIGMGSFFFTPAYEKGVWYVAGALSVALTAIMSYKFGKNMPQQSTDAKPGQTSQSDITTRTTPELPATPVAPPAPDAPATPAPPAAPSGPAATALLH